MLPMLPLALPAGLALGVMMSRSTRVREDMLLEAAKVGLGPCRLLLPWLPCASCRSHQLHHRPGLPWRPCCGDACVAPY